MPGAKEQEKRGFYEKISQSLFFCSDEDTQWLVDVLWKKNSDNLDIEVDPGFRLCIEQRDFMPGRSILDNISDGVEKSRRAIFILSK